jgi:protein SCO1/2
MQNSPPLPRRKTILFAAALVAAAVVLGVSSLLFKPPAGGPISTGTALVGGPFAMVNQNGETVTEKTFAGKYMLVFFGYTYCPDVCPTTLQVMATALDKLGAKTGRLAPIFVSIDPARDDIATMKAYIEAIDPRLTGLTGSPEQLTACFTRKWKVRIIPLIT